MTSGKYIETKNLTVGKLIEILKEFPENRSVVVKAEYGLGQDDNYEVYSDYVDVKAIDYSYNVVRLETTCL